LDGHGIDVVLSCHGVYHGNDDVSSKEMAELILRGVDSLSQEQLVCHCQCTLPRVDQLSLFAHAEGGRHKNAGRISTVSRSWAGVIWAAFRSMQC
jgi:hypothetical protein